MIDLHDLLARVDLAALADDLLGGHVGHGRSAHWPSPVPGHPQTGRTPPMSIYRDRHGIERWTCFATGAHGTAIDLLTVHRGCTVRDAIDDLTRRAHIQPRHQPDRTPAAALVGRPDPALHTYIDACEHWLWAPAGTGPRRWLTDTRHIPSALLDANRVGFDPGRRHLDRPDGLPHGPGIVLPTLTETGDPIYLQVRDLRPDPRHKYTNPAAHIATNPKIHWPQPARPVNTDPLIVCEGVIDALTITNHAHRAVALLSAAYVTPTIARLLAQRPEHLVLAFDHDPAGDTATTTLLARLHNAGRHDRLTVLQLPTGTDLNDLATHQPDRLRALLRCHIRSPTRTSPSGGCSLA